MTLPRSLESTWAFTFTYPRRQCKVLSKLGHLTHIYPALDTCWVHVPVQVIHKLRNNNNDTTTNNNNNSNNKTTTKNNNNINNDKLYMYSPLKFFWCRALSQTLSINVSRDFVS